MIKKYYIIKQKFFHDLHVSDQMKFGFYLEKINYLGSYLKFNLETINKINNVYLFQK